MPGVHEANVNVPASRLTVVHDGEAEPIAQAIRAIGFGATLEPPAHLPVAPPAPRSFLKTHLPLISAVVAALFFAEGWLLTQALVLPGPPDPVTGIPAPAKPHWLPIAFYILAALTGGFTTFRRGLGSLKRLTFDMNALMTIGVAGAIAIGQFGEAAAVAMLYAVSNWLEGRTMAKTRAAIGDLLALTPREATIRRGHSDRKVPVAEIQPGDVLVVKPGERIAMDGTVQTGSSAVNQAPLTGESVPVPKEAGATVLAGSINGAGALEVEVTRRVEDSTLARIIHMVEEAQAEKAPSQAFIDKFAAVYTPIVLVVALLVATIPLLLIDEANWFEWVYRGLALIVLACPCALVVSTPVALVAAIGGAARHGLLIKGGRQLEAAAKVKALAFDKTGTLTEGRPEVLNVAAVGDHHPQRVLAVAAAVEARSEHPLAQAIVRHAQKQGVAFEPAANFQATAHGGTAELEGRRWHVGSARYFEKLGLPIGEAAKQVDRFQNDGKTVVIVADESGPVGVIALQDALRGATRRTVIALNQLGIEPVAMLTGDTTQTARAIAKLAAIDEVKAELMPEDKVGAVKQLMAKYGATAMVGDGVNDAPALATAHVGMAMGKGTDVALETADVVLMNDDVSRVPYFFRLSRETMAVITQNVVFSIGIKVVAVLAIVPGWLTLWLAVLADMGATILVTLNALRLLTIKPSDG